MVRAFNDPLCWSTLLLRQDARPTHLGSYAGERCVQVSVFRPVSTVIAWHGSDALLTAAVYVCILLHEISHVQDKHLGSMFDGA